MAIRSNHYDRAFEEFLREQRLPHVVVDEKRRALMQQASLKSVDFVVYSEQSLNLLVEVKGRRFPSGGAESTHRTKWENWTTSDDIVSLSKWQQIFGGGFRSLLVFAYHICDSRWLDELEAPFAFRNRLYAFYGVWADDYQQRMRRRSARWETVSLPSQAYRELRQPIATFL